jgi:hypothetical protein
MVDQTSNEQAAVENREASKIKRVGQTCVSMFVVFVISLLSFGKAPFAKVTGTDGSRVNFNLISCLGVAMGVFAFIFVLTNFKRILRLMTMKKVLGLIGWFGLIVHAILALLLPLSYGAGTPAAVGTAGNQLLAQSGPEEWIVDGKAYKIASTYYLRLPEGFQYTIEYPYRFSQTDRNMDDDRALAAVFPLMKHAYTNGLHTRASVTKIGQGALVPSRIGVTLFEKDGGNTRGYRVALSLDQIKKRIEQESASRSTMPSDPMGGSR